MAVHAASRWQKWRQLDRQQQKLFISSVFLLKTADLLLHFFLYQNLYQRLAKLIPLKDPAPAEVTLVRAAQTAAVVELAADGRLANATCLRRSLVLWYLLRRDGIDSDLRLGVRKQGSGVFGHAWVEIDGTVINDEPDVIRQYTLMELERRS